VYTTPIRFTFVGKFRLKHLLPTYRALIAGLMVLAFPMPASAYIDPGVTALVSQWLFAFIFGGLITWVLAPWHYLKSLFQRAKPKVEEVTSGDGNDNQAAPDNSKQRGGEEPKG